MPDIKVIESRNPNQASERGGPHESWEWDRVPLEFQLGDFVFARGRLPLYRRSARLNERRLGRTEIPDGPRSLEGAVGYVVWSQPISGPLPRLQWRPGMLVYVPRQFRRFSIDLTAGFGAYMARFSGKTRSTLKRKLRKFAEASHGTIDWKKYRTPEQINKFIILARSVSAKTYQERLLKRGLPSSDDFLKTAQMQASQDKVRAYLLFLDGKPISYLYFPASDGVLIYNYLGYDPDYSSLYPGTVLHLLAFEAIFAENCFTLLDFNEGEGQHKELFSTGNCLCANIYVINRNLISVSLILLHHAMDKTSSILGTAFEKLHLKTKARRLLRRIR